MLKLKLTGDFQKSIAEQLELDGLGSIKDGYLLVSDKDVYQLSTAELGQLDAPDYFAGTLTVTLVGRGGCRIGFDDEFARAISAYSYDGCILRYDSRDYILPYDMFCVLCKVHDFIETQNSSIMFEIIELIRSFDSGRIRLVGWNNSETIIAVPKIKIDIQIGQDGSSRIRPYLEGVSEQNQEEHLKAILKAKDTESILEIQQTENGRARVRHVIHSKELEAYKRIFEVGTLSPSDTEKFLRNPTAFILDGDESVDDVAINFDSYRILGMDKPYHGHFGSNPLDSPIAKALKSDDVGEQDGGAEDVKSAIRGFCNNKSLEEITKIKDGLWKAIENDDPSYELEPGNIIPNSKFHQAFEFLEKIIKKAEEQVGPDPDPDSDRVHPPTKIVISIAPNDEISVQAVTSHLKTLDKIRVDDLEMGQLFDDFKSGFHPKSYQIQGVNWLVDLHRNRFHGGILADDMGLGKTFQLIAFITYLINRSDDFEGKRILIVAPKALLDNWNNEFEKFLKPEVLENVAIRVLRGRDLSRIKKSETEGQGHYNTFDVKQFLSSPLNILLLSYETLSNYQFAFADPQFNWGCIIYDEAHKIKNPNAQTSQAARAISSLCPFNVLLTGTPIENELRDLWALFDVFAPEHFGSWKLFKDSYVKNQKNDPSTEDRLRTHASKYLLRRLKKDYLKELPNKHEIEHTVTLTEPEIKDYLELRDMDEPTLTRLHKLKMFSLVGKTLSPEDICNFSKFKKLTELLDDIQQKQEKALIFIVRKEAQNILKHAIHKRYGIEVNIVNGETTNTQHLIDRFQSKEGFGVIILSTVAAGVGLTITAANHVFHYERWWNASKEDQASDRAYRIGQAKDVYIHYLLTDIPKQGGQTITTLDMAIHELISNKRDTAGFLIPPKNITTDEVVNGTGLGTFESILKQLDWKEFEQLVLELYQAQGYQGKLTPIGEEDYGADVIVQQGDVRIAVQCKHSSKGRIQDDMAIRGLVQQSRPVWNVNKLVAVTNTEFSRTAKQAAEEYGVELIEGLELIKLIREYKDRIPVLQAEGL